MKKKIIIVGHAMRLGGVETSLIRLLKSFDFSQYELDLFLHLHDEEFVEYILKELVLSLQYNFWASFL